MREQEVKPEKRSVAVAIRDPERPGRVLVVLRPEDDDDLPSTWGLPAASLRGDESPETAALRAGREKLGITLRLVGTVGEGRLEREGYRLWMREFEAVIVAGEPDVDHPLEGVTRYVAWEWGNPARLEAAARRGSLCSRIFLGEEESG